MGIIWTLLTTNAKVVDCYFHTVHYAIKQIVFNVNKEQL